MKNHKRRKLYIKRSFQTRFIISFFLIFLMGGVISIGLTLFNTQGTLTSSFVNSRLIVQNTSLAIMPSVIYTTLITTFAVGIVVIFFTLLVSHKIAGPIYRFEKDIDRISGGDLKSHIKIRKDDQFQEMVISLNNMIDNLNGRVSEIKKDVENLAVGKDLPEECRETVNDLKQKIDANFKL